MACMIAVVYSVVEFYGVVPVELAGECREAVVARRTCGKLHVSLFAFAKVYAFGGELLTGNIVEVVGGAEEHLGVIVMAKVLNAFWLDVGGVLACHMVGHEVNDNFHTLFVGALHQVVEFIEPLVDIHRQVRVDVVVVGDGVRAAGVPLYHMRVVAPDAVCGVVGVVRVFDYAGVPYMCDAEVLYGL